MAWGVARDSILENSSSFNVRVYSQSSIWFFGSIVLFFFRFFVWSTRGQFFRCTPASLRLIDRQRSLANCHLHLRQNNKNNFKWYQWRGFFAMKESYVSSKRSRINISEANIFITIPEKISKATKTFCKTSVHWIINFKFKSKQAKLYRNHKLFFSDSTLR